MKQCPLISLYEHCARLASFLANPEVSSKQPHRHMHGEIVTWLDASEWLHIASSVNRVEVDTSRFDESVMYCRGAWEFESAKSEFLSHFIARLSSFSFAWGGFEIIVKLVDPPKIPKKVHPSDGLVNRAIFFLKNEYEPMGPLALYSNVLGDFKRTLDTIPYYSDLSKDFSTRPFMGRSGVGLHLVRKIRNKFAHGAMGIPVPEGRDSARSRDARLIELSTRVIFLTIQMLLLAYFKEDHFTVDCSMDDEWGIPIARDVRNVLRKLHFREFSSEKSQ